jgi:hypothetical protein
MSIYLDQSKNSVHCNEKPSLHLTKWRNAKRETLVRLTSVPFQRGKSFSSKFRVSQKAQRQMSFSPTFSPSTFSPSPAAVSPPFSPQIFRSISSSRASFRCQLFHFPAATKLDQAPPFRTEICPHFPANLPPDFPADFQQVHESRTRKETRSGPRIWARNETEKNCS